MYEVPGIEMHTSPQQGWQCPICGRVYAPHIPMCFYCGGNYTLTVTTDTKGSGDTPPIYSETVAEKIREAQSSFDKNVLGVK